VKTDNNGNPYVCGYTAEDYLTQGTNGYVAKINANGSFVWKQTYRGIADTNDYANNIEVLSGGGVIVAGQISDSVKNIPWVKYMRISTTGQVVWDKIFKVQDYMTVQTGLAGNNTQSAFYISSYIRWQIGALSSAPASYVLAINPSTGDSTFTRSYVDSLGYIMKPVDIHVDNYGSVFTQGYVNASGTSYGFLWKLNPLGTELCRYQYTTLFSFGVGVQDAIGFSIDNSGHPMCVFHTYASSTLTDAALVRFSSGCGIDWEVFYNGKANAYDYISGIKTDVVGNSYVGGFLVNDNTGMDGVIAKYDKQGNLLWSNLFDIDQYQTYSDGLEMDSYANLYLVSSIPYLGTSGVIKIDSAGNQVWIKNLPVTGTRMCIDTSDNLFVGGDPAGYSLNYSREFSFTFIDNAGVPGASHSMSFNNRYYTSLRSIAVDNNKNSFLAGPLWKDTNAYVYNVLIQKFDNNSNSAGYYILPGTDSLANTPTDVAKVIYNQADGFVYVACSAVPMGSTFYSQYLLKIDPATFSVNFTQVYNATNTANYHPYDMAISATNDIYITGNKLTASDGFFYVQKWDNSGNLVWERTFTSAVSPIDAEAGKGITLDAAGNVYATGIINPFGQGFFEYLVKIDPAGNILWKKIFNNYEADQYTRQYVEVNNSRVFVGTNLVPKQYGLDDLGLLKYCDIPDPVLSTNGPVSICNNSSYTIAAPAASAYQWSTGATTQLISVNTGGDYYATVYESDGCNKNTDTLHVNLVSPPPAPAICMVTVDSASTHNILYWDKTSFAGLGVIGFNMYREDLTNVYTLIASVPFSNLSEYHDMDPNANPNTTTKRYKISAVDSCGSESAKGDFHNTIYIVSNGSGQFSWNQLYTIENGSNPVNQYVLMRDDYNTGNWQQIASTAGTQYNINDVNFATYQPTANWRVETVWGISCTPTAKQSNGIQGTIVKSKSNITNNRVVGMNNSAGGNTQLAVYPNPAQSSLSVSFPASPKTSVKLLNLVGEEILVMDAVNSNSVQLDLGKIAAGIYLLQVENAAGKFTKRVVKE